MMDKCYVILESLFIKDNQDGNIRLKQLDCDNLFGMVAYATEEAAIDMAKSLQKSAKEVTDEDIIHKLPNVAELDGRLKYHKAFEMKNVVVTHKVIAIDILKSTPIMK